MHYDLDKLELLPLIESASWINALRRSGSVGWGYADYDLSNQHKNRRGNAKSKNAKAKHRRRYSRR